MITRTVKYVTWKIYAFDEAGNLKESTVELLEGEKPVAKKSNAIAKEIATRTERRGMSIDDFIKYSALIDKEEQ